MQLDDGVASFGSIEDGGGEGCPTAGIALPFLKDEIAKFGECWKLYGHPVSRLIRIRYGAMGLASRSQTRCMA